jgi:hypothetical protein
VGKVHNICRVKTDISVVLMIKTGLNPYMIIEFEDDLKLMFLFYVVGTDLSLMYLRVLVYTYT